MKCAENGAAVIVWKSEDYLKEASKQLKDKEVYLEVSIDSSAFVSTHYFYVSGKNKETWEFIKKTPNLRGFTYYQKFINGYMMYLGDQ